MRSIIAGVIILSTSTPLALAAEPAKTNYAQTLTSHRQTVQASVDKSGVDPVRSDEDALTKRIEQDKIRLDRVMDICPTC
jgi:hypothetical protein